MITEALIGVVTISISALAWSFKSQTTSLNRIGRALEKLALSVQYCPLNKDNHDKIKKQFEGGR